MPTLTVPQETLVNTWGLPFSWEVENKGLVEILRNQIEYQNDWSIDYDLVFRVKETGKIYQTGYSIGATECQEERPWEYEDEVTLVEVEPFEKTIIDYRAVAN